MFLSAVVAEISYPERYHVFRLKIEQTEFVRFCIKRSSSCACAHRDRLKRHTLYCQRKTR